MEHPNKEFGPSCFVRALEMIRKRQTLPEINVQDRLFRRLESPLTPDREMSKNSTPLLKSTCYLPVFYGLSHGTTLKKKGVALF